MAKKTAVNPAVQPPEGFDDCNRVPIDGWYLPEPGSVLYGNIVGNIVLRGDGAMKSRDLSSWNFCSPSRRLQTRKR